MPIALTVFLSVLGGLLAFTAGLHLIPKLGAVGQKLSAWGCRAPGLDLVVFTLTGAPWITGAIWAGWQGFGAAIGAQFVAVFAWSLAHEAAHPEAKRSPRIVDALNKTVGRLRNHAGLWLTAPAVPIFWGLRAGEVLFWPVLRATMGFPKLKQSDWVNVTRHKFDGLVGHDRIWCLYCDWMTGVYSLAGEMLRHVESFWCPIKFLDPGKCAKCVREFPDVATHWIPETGTVADAAALLEKSYADAERSWMGSPARATVTIEGKPAPTAPEPSVAPTTPSEERTN
ncbi:MAG: hypothetical protein AAF138_00155 [Planctomycetota bacterium]